MSITLEEAKALKHGDVLLDSYGYRWRVTGKVITWKRNPFRIRVPLKHGLFEYGYLTQSNLDSFTKEVMK